MGGIDEVSSSNARPGANHSVGEQDSRLRRPQRALGTQFACNGDAAWLRSTVVVMLQLAAKLAFARS